MKCPICGAINQDDDKKCFICGADLTVDPLANEKDELEQMLNDASERTKSIMEEEQNPKEKPKIRDYIISIIVIIIVLSLLCSCFSCIASLFVSNNEEKVKEYIESNDTLKEYIDTTWDDDSTTSDDDSTVDGQTEEEWMENFTYDQFELKDVEDDSISLQLPEQMKEVEIEEDEYDENDPDRRIWRYGIDFDIIQTGTMMEYSDMKAAADDIYKNGVDAGYCSDMQIEKDTISGYDAYKISGIYEYDQELLAVWVFEAPDKDSYVHYFAVNVIKEDKVLLDCKDTYVYKGMESEVSE